MGKLIKQAVIFDLDGTLANCNHRLHHLGISKVKEQKGKPSKNWDDFFNSLHKDTVNRGVRRLFDFIPTTVSKLIITARPNREMVKPETMRWLHRNYITSYDAIFFRKECDFRDDYIIKEEIYKKHIEGNYDVLFVVEDRTRVVKMWRNLGLTCLQCADGDF